jgi:hypothetical protein
MKYLTTSSGGEMAHNVLALSREPRIPAVHEGNALSALAGCSAC